MNTSLHITAFLKEGQTKNVKQFVVGTVPLLAVQFVVGIVPLFTVQFVVGTVP